MDRQTDTREHITLLAEASIISLRSVNCAEPGISCSDQHFLASNFIFVLVCRTDETHYKLILVLR